MAMIVLWKEIEVLCTAFFLNFFCGIPLSLGERITWQCIPVSIQTQVNFVPVECWEDKEDKKRVKVEGEIK